MIEERFDRAWAERTRLEKRPAELDRQIDATIARQVWGTIPAALEWLVREREEVETRLRADDGI